MKCADTGTRARATRRDEGPLRIVVHDYCGHPFQVQLSRELARRGHAVTHLFCPSVASPRGALVVSSTDPDSLNIQPVQLGESFQKYKPTVRLRQEWVYGKQVTTVALAQRPDVIISANTPLLAQRALLSAARAQGVPFVFWLQDLLGVGIRNVLTRRNRALGRLLSAPLVRLERRMLVRSDAVIAISEDFRRHLMHDGVAHDRTHVIENWAPLEEVPLRARVNRWREKLSLGDRLIVLYAGTLGYKHNPRLLLDLAVELSGQPDVAVVVASEGPGAEWLLARRAELRLANLRVIGFQPYEELPDMLGAADVLAVLLEKDAGVFSVPSKVLTNLCAGRPILAAVPPDNLAARVLGQSGAGVLVAPGDSDAFVAAAKELLQNQPHRDRLGLAGRAYAENVFEIGQIAEQFEGIFWSLQSRQCTRSSLPKRVAGTRGNDRSRV